VETKAQTHQTFSASYTKLGGRVGTFSLLCGGLRARREGVGRFLPGNDPDMSFLETVSSEKTKRGEKEVGKIKLGKKGLQTPRALLEEKPSERKIPQKRYETPLDRYGSKKILMGY